MPSVYIKDYDVEIDFPDTMSDREVQKVLARDYPSRVPARTKYEYDPYEALGQGIPDMTGGKAGDIAQAMVETPGIVAKKAVQTIQQGGPGAGAALMQYGGELGKKNLDQYNRDMMAKPGLVAGEDYTPTLGMETPSPSGPIKGDVITDFMRIGNQCCCTRRNRQT